MALVTVADVIHTVLTPLPGGYTLLGGAQGLAREITWTIIARPSSPIFSMLKPGEIALASAASLHLLDPPANLALLIDGLAERGAAGLVLRGRLAPLERADATRAADAESIPLLLVSEEIHLADIDRAITTLVRERRDEFYSRVAHLQEVQFQLTEGAPGGHAASLDTLVSTLAGQLRAPVALTGPPPGLEVYHLADAPGGSGANLPAAWTRLVARAVTAWQAPDGLSGARPAEPPVLTLDAGASALLVAPMLVRERLAAALLALVPLPAAEIDTRTLARAAGIGALELARRQAVVVAETRTEQRLRGEFLADLLHHPPGQGEEILLARARALGIEIAPACAVALLATAPDPAEILATDAEYAALGTQQAALAAHGVLASVVGGRLALLWPVTGRTAAGPLAAPPDRFPQLAEDLRRLMGARPSGRAAGGVGRVYAGVGGAARSRQEAEQALWSAWHLFGGDRVCTFSELGIYRLLLPLRDGHQHELRAFYTETLGALSPATEPVGAGDGPHAKLLETLDSFLAHGGNHSETAAALYLHRNTLSYRLRRIAEVTGLDLDDPAVRFRLQVALCVRRLLT